MAVVKIDNDLLKQAKQFIRRNKIEFPSVKSFINQAVKNHLKTR